MDLLTYKKPVIIFFLIYMALVTGMQFAGGVETFKKSFKDVGISWVNTSDVYEIEYQEQFNNVNEPDLLYYVLTSQEQRKQAIDRARKEGKSTVDIGAVKISYNVRVYMLAFITFLSLIIATPMKWIPKVFSLITGLALVCAFIYGSMHSNAIYYCLKEGWFTPEMFGTNKVKVAEMVVSNGGIEVFILLAFILWAGFALLFGKRPKAT